MTVETFREHLNDLQLEVEELRAKLKEAQTGDTISRQAAIDALREIEFSHYMEFGEYIGEDTREVRLIRAEKAQDTIEQLPSAQPEQRWIPCSERLPEKEGTYIVTDDAGGMATVSTDEFSHYESGEPMWIFSQNVTAWMPLPEPYEERREDE